VAYVQAYGARNAKGDPLQTDTVMYGASLTKTVMAYTALTLVDQGKLDLDRPLADYLERPLISYREGQAHLADVELQVTFNLGGEVTVARITGQGGAQFHQPRT
jgi:CubicO group peptidase (beta-lactamase class C family)